MLVVPLSPSDASKVLHQFKDLGKLVGHRLWVFNKTDQINGFIHQSTGLSVRLYIIYISFVLSGNILKTEQNNHNGWFKAVSSWDLKLDLTHCKGWKLCVTFICVDDIIIQLPYWRRCCCVSYSEVCSSTFCQRNAADFDQRGSLESGSPGLAVPQTSPVSKKSRHLY